MKWKPKQPPADSKQSQQHQKQYDKPSITDTTDDFPVLELFSFNTGFRRLRMDDRWLQYLWKITHLRAIK